MTKKILLTLTGLLLLIGALVGVKLLQFQTMFAASADSAPPPETVTTVEVKRDLWQPTLNAIGSVTAVQGVTLSAEEAGTVRRIAFEWGRPCVKVNCWWNSMPKWSRRSCLIRCR